MGVWGSGSGRRLGRRTFPGVAPPPGGRSIPVEASRPGLRVHKRPGAELLRLTGAARLASGTWAKWRDVRSGRDLHRVGLGLGLGSGLGSGLGLALRRVRVRVGARVRVGVGVGVRVRVKAGVRVRVKAGVGVRVKAGVGVRNAAHLSSANLSANLLPAPDPLRCFSALRASSAASAELFE